MLKKYYHVTERGEEAYFGKDLWPGNATDFHVLETIISHEVEEDVLRNARNAYGRLYERDKVLRSLVWLEESGYIGHLIWEE